MKTICEKYILFCIYIFIFYLYYCLIIILLGKDLHKFVTLKFKLNTFSVVIKQIYSVT